MSRAWAAVGAASGVAVGAVRDNHLEVFVEDRLLRICEILEGDRPY